MSAHLNEPGGWRGWRHSTCRDYLGSPVSIPAFGVLLLLLYAYSNQASYGPPGVVVTFLVLLGGMLLVRLPRRIVYAATLVGMLVLMAYTVLVVANDSQDADSDRDDAVEIGARALMDGENPWNRKSILGLPITTGPSSMFLALPFVYATGHINTLSVVAWAVFLAFLVAGDLRYRNNSLLTLCLVMVFPWAGFLHTWNWSLDELFYPAILLPILWAALKRRRWLLAGGVAAFLVFSRLSYVFAVFAVGVWWLLGERRSVRECLLLLAGGALYALPVLGVLLAIGGEDFVQANFLRTSQLDGLTGQNHWLAHAFPASGPWLPTGIVGIGLLIGVLVAVAGLGMRSLPHPFFHVGFAMLLAHTVGFNPGAGARDYLLTFMIPVMYAIAYGRGAEPPAAVPVK